HRPRREHRRHRDRALGRRARGRPDPARGGRAGGPPGAGAHGGGPPPGGAPPPMTGVLDIEPVAAPFDVDVQVPGSKSLTNRALLCAALARGSSRLTGVLFADDTEAMLECVSRLGATVVADRLDCTVDVDGLAGRLRPGPLELDARLSG